MRIVVLILLLLASTSLALVQTPVQPETESAYVCPMHPDFTLDIEGKCSRCGMALVRAAPYDVRDYRLDFATVPAVVKPGQKATFRLNVFHPGTGEQVRRFETVHERQYHLFAIGQDMEYFEHLHPEQRRDGSWSIDVTLPKAGYYKILSDFMPGGGSPQFIARPLVTAGYLGDLAGGSARLIPDTTPAKTVDDVTATVAYDPARFVAGLYGHLNFTLTDARTGRPVTDLQTYLGEFGHMLIMSEDMLHYVHSHPLNLLATADDDGAGAHLMLPAGADLEKLRGGPEVSFDGLMPQPGLYRAWAQFRRNDKIYTFAFTFEVEAP
ncbi:MAG: hypothetical protein HYU27_05610 [Acidobacteria bacterium]|nr:hypothetical protein [Acidobacteriota bacterium]